VIKLLHINKEWLIFKFPDAMPSDEKQRWATVFPKLIAQARRQVRAPIQETPPSSRNGSPSRLSQIRNESGRRVSTDSPRSRDTSPAGSERPQSWSSNPLTLFRTHRNPSVSSRESSRSRTGVVKRSASLKSLKTPDACLERQSRQSLFNRSTPPPMPVKSRVAFITRLRQHNLRTPSPPGSNVAEPVVPTGTVFRLKSVYERQ
jgi:hypothetical protein